MNGFSRTQTVAHVTDQNKLLFWNVPFQNLNISLFDRNYRLFLEIIKDQIKSDYINVTLIHNPSFLRVLYI